jgi:adenylate kinase family enzyme
MRRIHIMGSSGAGKTLLGQQLSRALGITHVELDALYHGPDWQPAPVEEFRRATENAASTPSWVIDGNYASVQDLLWRRADTVIFLDLPRWRVMTRLLPRTLRRVTTRQVLWNGNREGWRSLLGLDREHNVWLWSWSQHHPLRAHILARAREPGWQHLRFVHVTTPAQLRELVSSLGREARGEGACE